MSVSDDANRYYGASTEQADKANKLFYERFGSFPPPPRDWRTFAGSNLWRDLVMQEIGDWDHVRLVDGGKIWVAGCGAVQAVEVALNYPSNEVLATDISETALDFGRSLARQIGIKNLTIKTESMFDATYEREFDMVISRGVIHHTANPQLALQKLAAGLKPDGILDLTVLNRSWEGWQMLIPFQKALRILCSSDPDEPQFDFDFQVGKQLAREFEGKTHFISRLRDFFPQFNLSPDLEKIPDHFLGCMLSEPNMHSYTVASFDELCAGAGLSMMSHGSLEPWMAAFNWDLELESPKERAMYDALPQLQRWQMTSLLLPKQPRVLRFFTQQKTSSIPLKDDRQITAEFLARRFEQVASTATFYTRSDDPQGEITGSRTEAWPVPPADPEVASILAALDPAKPLVETLKKLGLATDDFRKMNVLRRRLTTPVCPYLRSI